MAYSKVINDMYEGVKTRIRILGRDSERLLVFMGLHWESNVRPFLFTLMMDAMTYVICG